MDSIIDDKVIAIIAELRGRESSELTQQLTLANDLAMDSITILQMLVEFETAFDIEISDTAVAKIKTVGELVTYVRGLI